MLQFSIGEAKVRRLILESMKRKGARICFNFWFGMEAKVLWSCCVLGDWLEINKRIFEIHRERGEDIVGQSQILDVIIGTAFF